MTTAACANKTVLVFGILELLLAAGIITCGIMNIVNKSRLYKVHHGLWGGGYMAMTALFAIFAGLRQRRGMHITHMILAILGLIFVLPGTGTIFALEMISDVFYSYWTDDSYCYNCFWSTSNGNTYSSNYYNNWGSSATTTDAFSGLVNSVLCSSSDLQSTFCHPNWAAVRSEQIALILGTVLFVFLIISASFNCCAICGCCGARNEAVAVYPMVTTYSTGMNAYPPNAYGGSMYGLNSQVPYSSLPYNDPYSQSYSQAPQQQLQLSPYGQPAGGLPPQQPTAPPGANPQTTVILT